MVDNNQTTKTISLEEYGIKASKINYQLTSQELHEETLAKGQGKETNTGALAINTGEFTGRSPKDRFIVKDEVTADRVWWSKINIPFEADKFDALYDRVVAYLNGNELYVRDCYACADINYKLNIRVINEHPWSNMFVLNMFLRPNAEELEDFNFNNP